MIEAKNVDCVQQAKNQLLFFLTYFCLFFLAQKKPLKGEDTFCRAKISDIFCPHATLAFRRVKWKVEDEQKEES